MAKEYSRKSVSGAGRGGVFLTLGDITAFGIDAIPDHRISAQEFIDYVNERKPDSAFPVIRSATITVAWRT